MEIVGFVFFFFSPTCTQKNDAHATFGNADFGFPGEFHFGGRDSAPALSYTPKGAHPSTRGHRGCHPRSAQNPLPAGITARVGVGGGGRVTGRRMRASRSGAQTDRGTQRQFPNYSAGTRGDGENAEDPSCVHPPAHRGRETEARSSLPRFCCPPTGQRLAPPFRSSLSVPPLCPHVLLREPRGSAAPHLSEVSPAQPELGISARSPPFPASPHPGAQGGGGALVRSSSKVPGSSLPAWARVTSEQRTG